jgi:hypothetical protein
LSPDEIDKIVTPLLTDDFKAFGYKDKSIKEDETFDGEPVIRVKVDVAQPVPAKELVQTLARIHDALREQSDERFVFLSAPGPEIASHGGDEDEDI